LLWFGLALGPTAQIMPHHLDRADRFLYLPLAGLAVALAGSVRPLGKVFGGRAGVIGLSVIGAAGLLLMIGRTSHWMGTWRNSTSVWKNCVALNPNNAFAQNCLADCLADEGRYEEAFAHFETALRIDPYNPEALNNFAFRLATCGWEELRDYDKAIRLATRGCEAAKWKDATVRRTLAVVHMNLATAQARDGLFELAIKNYRRACEVAPKFEVPLLNLARLLATCPDEQFRRPDEALRLAEQTRALIGEPDALQLIALADVYAETGQSAEAERAMQKAVQLAEDDENPPLAAALRGRLERYRNRMGPTIPPGERPPQ
jgi:tetratricopeptide (TPR) repeat protein